VIQVEDATHVQKAQLYKSSKVGHKLDNAYTRHLHSMTCIKNSIYTSSKHMLHLYTENEI